MRHLFFLLLFFATWVKADNKIFSPAIKTLTAMVNDSVSTAFSLKRDEQLKEAIKYLTDMNLYKKAISAPAKGASKKAPTKKK